LRTLVVSYNFICQILSKNAEERDLTFHRRQRSIESVVGTWEVKKCECQSTFQEAEAVESQ
jgi:hypothetical protein